MNKRLEAEKVKKRIAGRFLHKYKCSVPNCSNKRGGMTIHHRWYLFNDVIYSSYPKTSEGMLRYYTDLVPVVKAMPKRFRYLCNKHHQALERLIRYNDLTLNYLLKERRASKRNGRK